MRVFGEGRGGGGRGLKDTWYVMKPLSSTSTRLKSAMSCLICSRHQSVSEARSLIEPQDPGLCNKASQRSKPLCPWPF